MITKTPTTEQLKARIWQITENKREVFRAYGERMFKSALNEQFAPFISELRSTGKMNYDLIKVKPMRDAFILLYGRVGAFFASETYGQIKKSYHPKYNIKRRRRRRFVNEQDAEVLESTWLQYMRRFATEQAGDRIVGITDTTKKFVRKSLESSINEGFGIEKAAKLLVKEWTELTKRRAKVIAQTEIVGASNAGSFTGAQSTGLNLEKEWISTAGPRTRDTHRALNGKTVGMEETFSNGLLYPGDPKGPASEVIACRCTIGYVVLD